MVSPAEPQADHGRRSKVTGPATFVFVGWCGRLILLIRWIPLRVTTPPEIFRPLSALAARLPEGAVGQRDRPPGDV